MLIHFKGKGCKECPFFHRHHLGVWCWMNGKEDSCGYVKFNIDFSDVDIDEEDPGDTRPKGCPFELKYDVLISTLE